jgi:hypothetical protein
MYTYDRNPDLLWRVFEVVKEINDGPHLLACIEISGTYFPHRAVEPFVRIIVSKELVVSCLFTDVSPDNRSLVSYFPIDLPSQGMIEFGYGNQVMDKIPAKFSTELVTRLDQKKLSEKVIIVTNEYWKTTYSLRG